MKTIRVAAVTPLLAALAASPALAGGRWTQFAVADAGAVIHETGAGQIVGHAGSVAGRSPWASS